MTRARSSIIYFLLALAWLMPVRLLAAMSSTDYFIYADSVGVGGDLSTGGVYSLQDTVGEISVGVASSSIYEVRGGYQYMERGTLSLAISNSSLDLGTLDSSTVSSDTTTATVVTDSASGYTLSVGAVSGTSIAAVSDGAVSAGFEEYGVAVSGADAAFGDDRGVETALVLASAVVPATGNDSVMTFKAAISESTAAGSYSQTVTLSATANF